jgi:hypothetical protein
MSPNRIETAEDLERIVAAQTTAIDALDKLVRPWMRGSNSNRN